MSPEQPKSRTFRRIALEGAAWIGGIVGSFALAVCIYSAAGKTFTTTINDRLALPKELAVTSQEANIPLPPELGGGAPPPVIPGSASAAIPAFPPPVTPGSSFASVPAAPVPGAPAPPPPGAPAPAPAPAPNQAPAPPPPAPRPAPAPAPAPSQAPATQPRPAPTNPPSTNPPTTEAPAPPTTAAPEPELPVIGEVGNALGFNSSNSRQQNRGER